MIEEKGEKIATGIKKITSVHIEKKGNYKIILHFWRHILFFFLLYYLSLFCEKKQIVEGRERRKEETNMKATVVISDSESNSDSDFIQNEDFEVDMEDNDKESPSASESDLVASDEEEDDLSDSSSGEDNLADSQESEDRLHSVVDLSGDSPLSCLESNSESETEEKKKEQKEKEDKGDAQQEERKDEGSEDEGEDEKKDSTTRDQTDTLEKRGVERKALAKDLGEKNMSSVPEREESDNSRNTVQKKEKQETPKQTPSASAAANSGKRKLPDVFKQATSSMEETNKREIKKARHGVLGVAFEHDVLFPNTSAELDAGNQSEKVECAPPLTLLEKILQCIQSTQKEVCDLRLKMQSNAEKFEKTLDNIENAISSQGRRRASRQGNVSGDCRENPEMTKEQLEAFIADATKPLAPLPYDIIEKSVPKFLAPLFLSGNDKKTFTLFLSGSYRKSEVSDTIDEIQSRKKRKTGSVKKTPIARR